MIRDINELDDANLKRGRGFSPKKSSSRATPFEHTMGKSSSYISTSRVSRREHIRSGTIDPNTGRYMLFFNPDAGRVEINLFRIASNRIIDLRTRVAQQKWGIFLPNASGARQQVIWDTIRTMEVLIHGEIPPNAIRRLTVAPTAAPRDDIEPWP